LLIRPEKLGDAYVTLPLINAIKRQRADIAIDWVASPRQLPLITGESGIDRIHIYDRTFGKANSKLLSLAHEPWTAVLDLIYGDSVTGLTLCSRLAPNAVRIAAHKNDLADCYDQVITHNRETPAAETALALLDPLGLDKSVAESIPRLAFSHGERAHAARVATQLQIDRRSLAVNISAGKPTRLWPDEKFVAALNALSGIFTMRVLICSPPDRPRAARIAKAAAGHVEIAPPDLDIRTIAALLSHFSVVVTPDTVIAHLAASVTATVALYPGVEWNFRRWRAQGDHVICLRASHADDIADIPAAAVTDAARQLHQQRLVAKV
jgi:ADP-heptose:LPS heptosyltransferase